MTWVLKQFITVITFEIFLRLVGKLVTLQSVRILKTLWTLIMITFIWPFITVSFLWNHKLEEALKVFVHWSQANDSLFVWILFMCCFQECLWAQITRMQGRPTMCLSSWAHKLVLLCVIWYSLLAKDWSQRSQGNFFFLLCRVMCFFKLLLVERDFWQILHWNDIAFMWTPLWWPFKLLTLAKDLEHVLQLMLVTGIKVLLWELCFPRCSMMII